MTRRTQLRIAGVVAGIVSLLVVPSCGCEAVDSTATAPPAPSTRTFADEGLGLAFDYDASFQLSQNTDWDDTAGDRLLDVVLKRTNDTQSSSALESTSFVSVVVFDRAGRPAATDLDDLVSEAEELGAMEKTPREIEFSGGDTRVITPEDYRSAAVDGLPAVVQETGLTDHLADGGVVDGRQISYYFASGNLRYFIDGDLDTDGDGEVLHVVSSINLLTP
jgi:hypothetical protein